MAKIDKYMIDICESLGFHVGSIETRGKDDYYVELNQSTPAGEDWWETIDFNGTTNDFINGVIRRYNSFDIDDEVEPYVEMRGTRGVPSSIKVLLEDAEWKEEQLNKLSAALQATK